MKATLSLSLGLNLEEVQGKARLTLSSWSTLPSDASAFCRLRLSSGFLTSAERGTSSRPWLAGSGQEALSGAELGPRAAAWGLEEGCLSEDGLEEAGVMSGTSREASAALMPEAGCEARPAAGLAGPLSDCCLSDALCRTLGPRGLFGGASWVGHGSGERGFS